MHLANSFHAEVAAAPHGLALSRHARLTLLPLRPAGQCWKQRTARVPPVLRPPLVGATSSQQPQPGSLFIEALVGSAAQQRRQREWEATCQEVTIFQQAHGRLPRHAATALGPLAEGERRLADWCTYQRQRKEGSAGGPLAKKERAALEAIPGWHWLAIRRAAPVPWDTRLQQLAAFVAQHGRLPRTHITATSRMPALPLERELGRWCGRQRQRQKGKTHSELSAAERAALEAIPGWYWEEWVLQPWKARLGELAAFQRQHGRLPRQKGSKQQPLVEGQRELGVWCGSQRLRWKGLKLPALSAEQVAALESIPGWWWEEQSAEPWDERLTHVAAFQQQHGWLPRCEGSKQQPLLEGELRLSLWIRSLRQKRRGLLQPPLTAEQVAALEAAPGWWWDDADAWQQRLARVAECMAQHGRLPRATASKNNPLLEGQRELGQWCVKQRQRRKGNRNHGSELMREQVAALQALPGWSW